MADLIPTTAHLDEPWIMGYDLNPLLTLEEKKSYLSRAAEEGHVLVFEHDADVECAQVAFRDGNFETVGPFTLAER